MGKGHARNEDQYLDKGGPNETSATDIRTALDTGGFSGYSGYSGYSGFSGMGISGYSGYSGAPGTSASSGYSGYSGFSGYSGINGISGYQGSDGDSGYSGYSGYSGFSGQSFNPNQSLIPSDDITYDLGSSGYRWRDIYLSNGSLKDGTNTIGLAQIPKQAIGAINYYVDCDNGSNSNPGTDAEPFQTIQYAIDQLPKILVQHNVTIYLKSSLNYAENPTIDGIQGGLILIRSVSNNADDVLITLNSGYGIMLQRSSSITYIRQISVRLTVEDGQCFYADRNSSMVLDGVKLADNGLTSSLGVLCGRNSIITIKPNVTNYDSDKVAYEYYTFDGGMIIRETPGGVPVASFGDTEYYPGVSNFVLDATPGISGYSGYSGSAGTAYPWQGQWSAGVYAVNDCVQHNGNGYVCIQATTTEEPGIDTAYWDLLVEKGESGYSGYSGISSIPYPWKGTWSSGVYAVNDCVEHNGNGYVCTQITTTQEPGVDTAYWDLLVERGESGYSGLSGLSGYSGSLGDSGYSGYSGYSGSATAELIPTPDDHTASGIKIVLTAHETMAFGDACMINSSGEAQLAKADVIANANAILMCADSSISADNPGNFLILGIARDDTWSWNVGGLIYLSVTGTTGNTLTQVAPSGTNNVIQILGVATHAKRMLLTPNLVQIEHT